MIPESVLEKNDIGALKAKRQHCDNLAAYKKEALT